MGIMLGCVTVKNNVRSVLNVEWKVMCVYGFELTGISDTSVRRKPSSKEVVYRMDKSLQEFDISMDELSGLVTGIGEILGPELDVDEIVNELEDDHRSSLKSLIYASLHTSSTFRKIVPKSLKGRSKSSQDWLTRQLNDPYVKLARYENYRARSAFKLIEIDDRHKILNPGQVVVECGAAPGAWTQVAVSRVNSLQNVKGKQQGLVVGIDLLGIHPLPGAIFLSGKNFTNPETQHEILKILDGRKVNVVLSDMAPNASGTRAMDHENIIDLAYSALNFAVQHSALKASFLCKVWDGSRDMKLKSDMERYYGSVKVIKPNASRKDSSEKFLLGKNFQGIGT
ncbi:rRNA methyltransferase 2, mitochondrial-like [Macrobrachium nipponense]|uniref:rRNA methyltransferase 2, mitochondrial-like n=1 Tax=Macrobrachium nipponense TaxID=159736 RepID=UPI0030C7F9FF